MDTIKIAIFAMHRTQIVNDYHSINQYSKSISQGGYHFFLPQLVSSSSYILMATLPHQQISIGYPDSLIFATHHLSLSCHQFEAFCALKTFQHFNISIIKRIFLHACFSSSFLQLKYGHLILLLLCSLQIKWYLLILALKFHL